MKVYSKSILYLFHMVGLIIGRFSFVLSLMLWVFAIISGTKNTITDAITPEPFLTSLAIFFGFIWVISIFIYFLLSFFLKCDKCGKPTIWYTLSKQPESNLDSRNKIASFFIPDEVKCKQYTCPHCNTNFKLARMRSVIGRMKP